MGMMVRCQPSILLPVLLIGCSPIAPIPATIAAASELPPYLKGREVKVENLSPWYVFLESLSASRVGGSQVFGPSEKDQPGKVKTLSSYATTGYFDGIGSLPLEKPSLGDAMLLHVQAQVNENGPVIREAFIVLPRHALERTSGTITLTVDRQGLKSGGAYVTSAPWVVTAN